MVRIDPTRAQIVLRLVYDGPARAGKTTSLRALARSLGVGIFSGEEEDGRTLYLDWVDYVGGLFEGMPIRCQIVGVPGQAVLESRRRQLLQEADAVVFVIDSRPERMAENRRSYELVREIAAAAVVPIGIVVQANKRDYPNASSLDEIRDALGGGASLAMTEAIAERGEGVRETFVLGVRFALDRVRAMWAGRALETLPPEFETGSQLIAAMMEGEGGARPATAMETAAIDVVPVAHEPSSHPCLPDASIPSGMVWPPVHGRAIVHEAACDTIALDRADDGSWYGVSPSGRWHVSSPDEASFDDLEEGRTALIAWARWHAATARMLSPDRAIVLAPGGPGKWRLWQIVHSSHTLRDMCRDAVHLSGAAAGEKLFEIIDLRQQAHRALVAPAFVERINLQTVALSSNGDAVYAAGAAYPPPTNKRGPRPVEPPEDDDELIAHEIIPALRSELSAVPERFSELLAGIEAAGIRRGRGNAAQSLRRSLLND